MAVAYLGEVNFFMDATGTEVKGIISFDNQGMYFTTTVESDTLRINGHELREVQPIDDDTIDSIIV